MHPLRKANPILVFFLVAFGVPWSVQIFMAIRHIPLLPLWSGFVIANSFCSLAGFIATYCESGWTGVKELSRRCVRHRVSVGWWIYALFLCFAIASIAAGAYGLIHGQFSPLNPRELVWQWWLPFALLSGFILGPIGEEAGWRGYLLPTLLRNYSPLKSSLLVGLVWALWHFPEGFIAGGPAYFHSSMGLLLFTTNAICLSILMTILFLHSRMSVLLAMVFHWSGIPGIEISKIIFPTNPEPPDWTRAIALIVSTMIAIVVFRKELNSNPLRRQEILSPVK
jgi:uncharacterized protein